MRAATVVLVVFLALPAWADDLLAPPICAKTERHDYCALIMQRDNALNELAAIKGENWSLRDRVQHLNDYLNGYIAGTKWAGEITPYLVRACAKKAMKTQLQEQLCSMWLDLVGRKW